MGQWDGAGTWIQEVSKVLGTIPAQLTIPSHLLEVRASPEGNSIPEVWPPLEAWFALLIPSTSFSHSQTIWGSQESSPWIWKSLKLQHLWHSLFQPLRSQFQEGEHGKGWTCPNCSSGKTFAPEGISDGSGWIQILSYWDRSAPNTASGFFP